MARDRWNARFSARDPRALGRSLGRIMKRGGTAQWCWLQALRVSFETPDPHVGRRLTQAEFAARVAAEGGHASFSLARMSRALKAAYLVTRPPETEAERRALSRVFNGNESRDAGVERTPAELVANLLKRLRRDVTDGLVLGLTGRALLDVVVAAIRRREGCGEVHDGGSKPVPNGDEPCSNGCA